MLGAATATVGVFVSDQEAEGKGREKGGREYHKEFLGGDKKPGLRHCEGGSLL